MVSLDNLDLQKKLIELINSKKVNHTQDVPIDVQNQITEEDREFLFLAQQVIKKHQHKIDPTILKLLNRLKYVGAPHGGFPLVGQNFFANENSHYNSPNSNGDFNNTNNITNNTHNNNNNFYTTDSIQYHFPDLLTNPFTINNKKRRISDDSINFSNQINSPTSPESQFNNIINNNNNNNNNNNFPSPSSSSQSPQQLHSLTNQFQQNNQQFSNSNPALIKQLNNLITNMNPSEQHHLYNQLNNILSNNNINSNSNLNDGGNNNSQRQMEMSINYLLQSLNDNNNNNTNNIDQQQQQQQQNNIHVNHLDNNILDDRSDSRQGSIHNINNNNNENSNTITPTTTTTGRQYICVDCSMQFRRSSDLKRHEKIHLKVPPNICPLCEKGFARKDALKRHIGTLTCNRNKERLKNISNGNNGGSNDNK